MAPRRQRSAQSSAAIWLAAAATATVLAAGASWWVSRQSANDDAGQDSTGTTSLPPSGIVKRLASRYKLHVVVPSPSGKSVKAPPSYLTETSGGNPSTFDPKRLLAHETPSGVVHIARFLGGTLIIVNGVMTDDADEDQAAAVADGGIAADALTWQPCSVNKLIKDTKTFVRGIIIAQGESDGEALDKDVANHVVTVEGWQTLCYSLNV
ncbi:hypothetical protein OIO90_002509 [Microbotryomycetes sp. JL221]|nr:hypothetical protein OIO90_002509 [Microbotryomycetes sp. JL221]